MDKIGQDGKPLDKSYLELHLPKLLQESLDRWKPILAELKEGKSPHAWDWYFCDLQTDINVAEVEQMISEEQAWYLREKYLGITQ